LLVTTLKILQLLATPVPETPKRPSAAFALDKKIFEVIPICMHQTRFFLNWICTHWSRAILCYSRCILPGVCLFNSNSFA